MTLVVNGSTLNFSIQISYLIVIVIIIIILVLLRRK